MTTEELKATLIACINAYSLKAVLNVMAEIVEDATSESAWFRLDSFSLGLSASIGFVS